MSGEETTPDVSVVIPVYNPGHSIDAAIESLLAQTLPSDRLEIIFIDDGSTDGVSERLDQLSSQHAHIHAIHQPNSGWPGKPRNVGIEAATGAYIQFLDHDDMLGREALERLYAMGMANDSDIVIGKVTSDFRPVPLELFRHNVARCSLTDPYLIHSLAPHKMFKRQFLLDTGIRYPEGRRRLEDQKFVIDCFFATDAVSVLADYPCYFYRQRRDGSNISAAFSDPAIYYHYLRDVLDVVVANTEPGPLQDQLLSRFLNDLIRRLRGIARGDMSPVEVDALYQEVRRLTLERFPASVSDGLPTLRRYSAAAIIDDRIDRVIEIIQRQQSIETVAQVETLTWADTHWVAQVSARMIHTGDRSPIVVMPTAEGWLPDPRLVPSDMTVRTDSTEELLTQARCDVVVRDVASKVQWFAASDLTATLEPVPDRADGAHELVFRGTAELGPTMPFGTDRLTNGKWNVQARIRALGHTKSGPIDADHLGDVPPALVRPKPVLVSPRFIGPNGRLRLVVRRVASVSKVIAAHASALVLDSGTLVMPVALQLAGGNGGIPAFVILGDQDGEAARRRARITASSEAAVLTCRLGAAKLPRGNLSVSLQVRPKDEPQQLGVLTVDRRGRARAVTQS
jgi:glycosyltransferase involved in cell wall biosynthesis